MLNTCRIGRLVTAALIVTALSATLAAAQSPLGIGTAEPAFKTTGFLGGFFAWVNMEQQGFYRLMTNALKGMRENPGSSGRWSGSPSPMVSFMPPAPATARR